MEHTLVESNSQGLKPLSLTPYQQTFYDEWLLNPSRSDYNMVLDQELDGELDIARLNQSLIRFVNDHLLMNSNVSEENGHPVWQERPSLLSDLKLIIYHDRVLDTGELLDLVRQPFDLRKDFLVRFHVVRIQENRHRLVYILPHILIDGLCYEQILKEGSLYYNDPDYAKELSLVQQKQLHQSLSLYLERLLRERGSEMESFWRQRLTGVEEVDLSFLKKETPLTSLHETKSVGKAVHEFRFGYNGLTLDRVRQLSRTFGLTPYVYGQLVYGILLHRFSRTDSISVNYPVSIREGGDLIYGAQVNTVFIDYRFSDGTDLNRVIADMLTYFRQLKAHSGKYLPVGQIIGRVNSRKLTNAGFVQTVLRDTEICYNGIDHVRLGSELFVDLTGELVFEQELGSQSLNYRVRYDSEQLDSSLVVRFVEDYQRLFEQILHDLFNGNADRKISDYDCLSAQAYCQQVYDWNQTTRPYPYQETIHGMFEQQVARTPDAAAVVFKDIRLTYRELNERSNRLAHYLRARYQVRADELVCLCLDRSEHMLVSILAVLKAGGAYVPLDPTSPAERINYQLADTGARVVLASEVHAGWLRELTAEIDVFSVDCPELGCLLESYPQNNPEAISGADDLAYVIYTSGTTGRPKGVMVQHGGIVNLSIMQGTEFGLLADDKPKHCLWYSNYVFDAHVWEVYTSLIHGKCLFIVDSSIRTDLFLLSEYIKCNNISIATIPPALLDKDCLLELEVLVVAGEATNRDILLRYHQKGIHVINAYGPTETTVCATLHHSEERSSHNNIGRPIANTSCYVLDKNLTPLPVGAIGELYIGGAGVARGYLNNEALTRERFIANPFQTELEKDQGYNGRLYKTGDLVRYLPGGNLQYLGRNDFQVKIRGYRIEPGEIESRLCGYEGIRQAVVMARESRGDSPYLVGYYVSASTLDEGQIKSYLGSHLPDYMVPAVLVHLESLPLTVNGKLDRGALPEALFVSGQAYAAPESQLQRQLCVVYGQVLDLSPSGIGIDDDFFGLGGNSISSIKLMRSINRKLGIELAISSILIHKSIRKLASYIAYREDSQSPIIALTVSNPQDQLLSFGQQRLWFLDQYLQGSSAYNIPMVVKLRKGVDADRLLGALQKIVERHHVLRSVIKTNLEGEGYQQVVDEPVYIAHNKVFSIEELYASIARECSYAFDLANEMPLRACLFDCEGMKYVSIVVHHIAFDGWSADVLVRELVNGYHQKELPALPFQYKDYALWQRSYLSGTVLDAQLEYWKSHLAGYETLALITDKIRPAKVRYEGVTLSFSLDEEVSVALRLFAKRLNVSVYSVLLSGFYLLLSKYSGQDDVVIGSPVANRQHVATHDLIGFFVNTLALRQKIDQESTLHNFVRRVGEGVQLALQHQDLPFEYLLDTLEVEKDESRHSIFQVMFDLKNFDNEYLKGFSDLFEHYEREEYFAPAKFDLSVTMDDSGTQLSGSFNYATSLFESDTIQRYIDTYKQILSALATGSSSQTVKSLNCLDEEEYTRQVYDWNRTANSNPQEGTIQGLFEQQVARTPDAIAVVYEGIRLTYRELNERSNRLAHYLRTRYQVHADELVCLYLDRSEHMLVSILAVLKAGGAYVPLDPSSPAERLNYQLADIGSRVVLASQVHAGKLLVLTAGIDVFAVDSPESDDLLENYPSNNPKAVSGAGDLAYVIYTSGTTGRSKGVMIQHGGVLNLVDALHRKYGFLGEEVVLQFANYVFDASVEQIFLALLNGHQLLLIKEQSWYDQEQFVNTLVECKVTHVDITPSLLSQLILSDVRTIRRIICGGEALHIGLLNQLKSVYQCSVINSYGPTETTVTSVVSIDAGNTSIGRPIANTSCYVLDKNLNPLPVGAIGELYIGGAGVARGYLNNDALTRERFISNPFQTELEKEQGYNGRLYKTGDLVRYLSDGNLQYLGRNDFQVKIRGYRIEPGEIESRLCGYEGIRQAVVMARESRGDSPYLVGYYVSASALDEGQIKSYLGSHLPDYMVPAVLVHLESLPLTVNGKLDRGALPEALFVSGQAYAAPESELQRQLCVVYGQVLDLSPSEIGIDDDFFGLGGNSISSIRLVSAIRKELDVSLSVSQVFSSRTVRLLSGEISSGRLEGTSITSVSVGQAHEQLLSYAQQRLWFIDQYQPGSWAYNIPMVVRLREGVDLDLLLQCLYQVVDRHHVLRSLILTSNEGTGYQQVADVAVEARSCHFSCASELEAAISRECQHVFDLSSELPLRICVYHLNEARYLSIVVHAPYSLRRLVDGCAGR